VVNVDRPFGALKSRMSGIRLNAVAPRTALALVIGLTGLAAAVPVLVVVAVLALNVILWGMAVMLGLMLFVLLLLRAVTAPFRRW